jgi:hypothetical protein
MKRQADGAGYLFNDDRNSGGKLDEADMVTCPHCEALLRLQDWRKEREQGGGGWCRKCFAPVCGPCLDRMLVFGCEPYLKKIDQAVEENYRRQQNRKTLGI